MLAGSGMCEAGRIRQHLKARLWDARTVVRWSVSTMETLGRLLQDGAPRVRIQGETFQVAARIVRIEGHSAHADGPTWPPGCRPCAGPRRSFPRMASRRRSRAWPTRGWPWHRVGRRGDPADARRGFPAGARRSAGAERRGIDQPARRPGDDRRAGLAQPPGRTAAGHEEALDKAPDDQARAA